MDKQFIDIAYDVAKVKYGKKPFTFKQIWTDFVKKAKLDEKEQKEAGEVYSAMLQDIRFIFVGKGQWKLREFLTLDEQTQLSNALYDFALEAEEEGSEAEAAKKKKKSAPSENEDTYYDEEIQDEMYDQAKQQALDESESDEEEEEETEVEENEEEKQ